jgi:hypothetical protein
LLEFVYQAEDGTRRWCALAVWAVAAFGPAEDNVYTRLTTRDGSSLLVLARAEAFRDAYLRAKSSWVTVEPS